MHDYSAAVGDLVRPTLHACRQLDSFYRHDLGIVTEVAWSELGRRAIVYGLWSGSWQKRPMAAAWLEKVNDEEK